MSTSPNLPATDINGRPFSLDLSPWGGEHEDAKHVPADSFVLPGNAVLRVSDRFCGAGTWNCTSNANNAVRVSTRRKPFPYIRLIKDDPELYRQMQAYAKGESLPDYAAELAAARAKVAELEEQAKRAAKVANPEFKVGDYVTAVKVSSRYPAAPFTTGSTHKVSSIGSDCDGVQLVDIDGDTNPGWFSCRFRPATEAEIAAYKAEYEKQEFKVGDYVTVVDGSEGPYHLARGSTHKVSSTGNESISNRPVIGVAGDTNPGWYSARFRPATKAEIAAYVAEHEAIKVGDWVVVKPGEGVHPEAPTGTILRVTEDCGNIGGECQGTRRCVKVDGVERSLHITRFRKATEAEITAEQARREIKVGDWVVVIDPPASRPEIKPNWVHEVERVDYANRIPHVLCKGMTTFWNANRFRKATDAEIAAEKERRAEKAKLVTVVVEGVSYTSKYKPGYVEFGCAHVSNVLIRHIESAMAGGVRFPHDNRAITGIQIGKGVFTREQIATLTANLVD